MKVLQQMRKAMAAITAALAGGVFAQAGPPDAEFVHPPPARPARLDIGDPACRPVYPPAAAAMQVQGESHLVLAFDAHGRFLSAKMLRGADATPEERLLDLAAAKGLSGCPFTPGLDADGKPVGGQMDVTYRWVPGNEGRILGGRDCRPEYPVAALRANAQGKTVLAFHVDATGKVLGVDILQSAGDRREHRLLDNAAARALATCPFEPPRDASGKAMAGVVTATFTWRLE